MPTRVGTFMGMDLFEDRSMPDNAIAVRDATPIIRQFDVANYGRSPVAEALGDVRRMNDMADALAYGVAGHRTEIEQDRVRISAIEYRRMYEQRVRQDERQREPFPVEVRLDHNPMRGIVEIETNIGRAAFVRDQVSTRDITDERALMDVARAQAARFAEMMERQIFEQLARTVNARREREYGGRGLTVEGLRHAADLMRGRFTAKVPRDDMPIPALADIKHRVIEHCGLKAELLDTTEKTWAEGDTMQHCFGKSYSQKVVAGDYIAYHISGGRLPKSGLTLGFSKAGDKWAFDQIKGKKNDTAHCRHPEVLEMIEHVHKLIGKASRRLPDEVSARMEIRADYMAGAVRTQANTIRVTSDA